jgi:hypothetical protein
VAFNLRKPQTFNPMIIKAHKLLQSTHTRYLQLVLGPAMLRSGSLSTELHPSSAHPWHSLASLWIIFILVSASLTTAQLRLTSAQHPPSPHYGTPLPRSPHLGSFSAQPCLVSTPQQLIFAQVTTKVHYTQDRYLFPAARLLFGRLYRLGL